MPKVKVLVAGCYSFCLFFIFYNLHTFIQHTFIQYIFPSPFAEAKEVIKEQPTPTNLSATTRRVLQCTRSQWPSCSFKERFFGCSHRTVSETPSQVISVKTRGWGIFVASSQFLELHKIAKLWKYSVMYRNAATLKARLHPLTELCCTLTELRFTPTELSYI